MRYRFDDIHIDKAGFELYRAGERVPIEPQVFDLLLHFVENPDRVLSRDELMQTVWSGRVVSDATISGAIKNLRKAIGDSGETQKYIKTVHGRGFRFSTGVPRAPERAESLSVRDPALLILPAAAIKPDSDNHSRTLQLIEDLERLLTRVPLLNISAQAGRYAGPQLRPAPRQIHDEIGVHFILDISVHCQAEARRVNVTLTDARAGFRLWSEQFVPPPDESDAEHHLVIAIMSRLEPELNRAIYQLVKNSQEHPTSRQLYLEASGLLALKGWHEDTFIEAAALLRKSIAQDDGFALAWANLALLLGFGHRVGLVADRDKTVAEVNLAGERALALDNMDSAVLGFTGCAFCDIGNTARGIPIIKNAVQRNPANGQAWAALGAACLVIDDLPAAIEHLTHGIAISPLDSRLSVWGAVLAVCHLRAGDLVQAAAVAEAAIAHDYKTYMPCVVLAAIQLEQNAPAAAAQALAEAYRIKPDLTIASVTGLVGEQRCANLLALR